MLAGAVEAFVLHPTDTVKTRLQLQTTSSNMKYKGMIHCFKTIIKEEGALALYKGLTPFTMHLCSKYALRFYTYNSFLKVFDSKSSSGNFMAGLCAGVVEAICIVTPFEVVKIRLQAQLGMEKAALQYKGPIHCAYSIIKNEGIFALWKGLTPTLIRNSSNQACNFMTFDLIKRKLWFSNGEYALSPWQTLITGFISGMIGPLMNGPADVIKTRLMKQQTIAGQEPKYKGFVHAFRIIWQEEGFLAFYKGIGPRLLRLAPGQAITWTVVEQVNYLFNYFENTKKF